MIIKIDMVRSMHLYAFWKVEQSSGPFENLFKLYGRHSGQQRQQQILNFLLFGIRPKTI